MDLVRAVGGEETVSLEELVTFHDYNVNVNLHLFRYWGFSDFAMQLNEPDERVAPTDSRFRPDQRELEHGKVDEAADEKLRLEELQRSRRKANANATPQYVSRNIY